MIKNVGKTDKTARIILGVVIILIGLYLKSWWGIIGLALIITGLINYCGLYQLFGYSSNKTTGTTPPSTPPPPTATPPTAS